MTSIPENIADLRSAIDLTRPHPADVLRSLPGQWARVYKRRSMSSAASTASRIRCGFSACWSPYGAFESTWDEIGGEYFVYARYVGGGAR